MAALVAVERHLWLTLSDMKEKDRVFLMDATLAPSGLYGNTVNSVVDRYQEARKQAAAFQRFLPRRPIALGAAGREQPQPRTSSSYREIQRYSVASRAPPQRDRGRQRPKNRGLLRRGLPRVPLSVLSTWKLAELRASPAFRDLPSSYVGCFLPVLRVRAST